jgi:DNA-binding NarL/FixJ family response regulator
VLLVDDEPRLRARLGAVLADDGVAILGEAGNGLEGSSWPAGCCRRWC